MTQGEKGKNFIFWKKEKNDILVNDKYIRN